MERTINEIYKLIEQKIENAERDRERNKYNSAVINVSNIIEIKKSDDELKGEIQAYTDIKILLETSGLVNQDKTKS